MGLLAPLYFAGLLAIALPVVFHLFRRAPSGRQTFSSLMFLSPSPPRLTRRSRLTNLVLLLLRAAALALLAFAFARPFLASADDPAALAARGRRVAVLVDTSASMRRGDLWPQAVAQAERALADLRPEDEAGLYFFDRTVRPAMTFVEWNDLPQPARAAVFRARLAAASPTWAGTRLGDALAAAADLLTDEEIRPAGGGKTPSTPSRAGRQLVLVSDLQQGGHAEALQWHQWPDGVLLQVRAVTAKEPTNASVRLADARDDSPPADALSSSSTSANPTADPSRLRVRVANQPGATREQFTLAWANDRGPVVGAEPVKLYLPAGRTQVIRVPFPPRDEGSAGPPATAPASAATSPATSRGSGRASRPAGVPPAAIASLSLRAEPDRLVLAGDDADFDNTLYVVPPRREQVRVLYVGTDAPDDVNGLRYYLQGALGSTPSRLVTVTGSTDVAAVAESSLPEFRLAVVTTPQSVAQSAALRRFVDAGGDVLWVLPNRDAAGGLAQVAGLDKLTVEEAPATDFALIGRVESDHPLFAPFAGVQYADFTKVHFWKHRRVTLPGPATRPDAAAASAAAGIRVLARFDDGDPFLLERPVGKGRVYVVTSGWHPADSQLALSTKFVPLVDGLVRPRDAMAAGAQQVTYEPIPFPPADAVLGGGGKSPPAQGTTTVLSWTGRSLLTPDGRKIDLGAGATAAPAEVVDRPGIYRVRVGDRETPVAVNLPPDEGRTAPLAVEELERLGAKLGVAPTSEELVARERQLRTAELENRQKLWRWIVLAVLGLLAVETAVAGVLARRQRRGGVGGGDSDAATGPATTASVATGP